MSTLDIILTLVNFAGALAVFLFGMKLMSEGLQKFAGNKMRTVMGRVTGNPVSGILTGAFVTTAIQSSSATTVMVVSFVNAGLLSLAGAVAVIMGANIGTTVTAWIITLLGLGGGDGTFSLPMLMGALSLAFIFSKKDRLKSVGEFLIGLTLLLVGMDLLKQAMPNLEEHPALLMQIATLSGHGFLSTLMFAGIGAVLTCAMQSSSAMMAVTLVMCFNGWIDLGTAVALVMGENIGTTVTANIAAMVTNSNGKRAARAHLLFNLHGVVLCLIFFRPILGLIGSAATAVTGSSPFAAMGAEGYDPAAIPTAISLFHTCFNIANTCLLAWFIPLMVRIVTLMVKDSAADEEDVYKLKYIGGGLTNTAELNMQAAQKEIEDFSGRVLRMYTFLPSLQNARDDAEFDRTVRRIEKYEAITDDMEMEIAKFLTRVSEGDLSQQGSQQVSAMLRIIDNLESIGDTIYQIAATRRNKRETAVHFDKHLNDNLDHMTELVQHSLDVMNRNLCGSYNQANLSDADAAERAINSYRDQLRAEHLEALRQGVYDFAVGNAYSGLYALYEKLGDYVINVSEAMTVKFK